MSKNAKAKGNAASIKVLWTHSDFEDCFYPVHDWSTQKKELTAMMDALKQGQPIDDKMRAEIVKALWFLYGKLRSETLVRFRGRRKSPSVRFATIAIKLVDKHRVHVKDAILAAIPDDGARLYETVATTYRKIRRGEIKTPSINEDAIKAAEQRLHRKKNGNK